MAVEPNPKLRSGMEEMALSLRNIRHSLATEKVWQLVHLAPLPAVFPSTVDSEKLKKSFPKLSFIL